MNCHSSGAVTHTGGAQRRAGGVASVKYSINYKISFYDLRYAFLHANLDDLNSVITAKIKMDDMLNNSFMYIIENDINKVLENYKRYNENRDKIKDIVDKEYIEKCDMYIGNFLEKLAKTIIV